MSNPFHSSESVEHYSPVEEVENSRTLLGGFTIDPASCASANRIIRADSYFTKETNGLLRPWHGSFWCNPPGGSCDMNGIAPVHKKAPTKTSPGRDGCGVTGACGLPPGHVHKGHTSALKAWWFKAAKEYMVGNAETGMFLVFNLELHQTSQLDCFNSKHEGKRLPDVLSFPRWYPKRRLKFLALQEDGTLKDGDQPTHANMLVYFPRHWSSIERARFEALFSDDGVCVWPDKTMLPWVR